MNNKFNIFVASSLSLREERKQILELGKELNQKADENKAEFSVFEYEESDNVLQIYNGVDAQYSAEENLRRSAFFILICDGVIGNKSVEEFLLARNLYENKKFPAYIYVFAKDYGNCPESCPKPGEYQISYKDFEKKYNLFYHIGHTEKVENYNKFYSIPYSNPEEIRTHMGRELEKVLKNAHFRPLIDAKRGLELSAEDFYSDTERKRHCNPGIYFKRNFDDDIRDALEDAKKFIYIQGNSLSGKTRAVLNAASKCPDTWFYIFNSYFDPNVVVKMHEIASYIERFKVNQSICIVFDDLGSSPLFSTGDNKEFLAAFRCLMSSVNEHENGSGAVGRCSVIFTGGVPLNAIDLGYEFEHIRIGDLSASEMTDARRFFQSLGETITTSTFRSTGALLIDLSTIRSKFGTYIKDNPIIGEYILLAIKLQSKWRRRNLGNVEYIKSLTEYFYGGELNRIVFKEKFRRALDNLCKCKGGIAKSNVDNKNLIIEEYVYRYVLDSDLTDLIPSDERELVDIILDYSYSCPEEPLIVTAGKLAKRCDDPGSVSKFIYEICTTDASKEGWKKELREEFLQIESSRDPASGDQQKIEAYSRILRFRMYASENFDEAFGIFKSAKGAKNELVLSALLKIAETQEDISKIEKLEQFDEDNPWIMLRRATKENTFAKAFGWVGEKFVLENAQDPELVAFYIMTMEHLLSRVSSIDELDQLIGQLRNNFEILQPAENREHLLAYGSIDPSGITLFDVLARFSTHSIITGFKYLMENIRNNGDESISESDFITGHLVKWAVQSAEMNITPRKTIRNIGCLIADAIMDQVSQDMPYEDILNDIFLRLEFEYTDKGNTKRKMKLWNTYLYNKMMGRKDCDYWAASGLFYNYLVPQTAEADNCIVVSRYVLNTLLNLSLKQNSPGLQRKTLDLFDRYSVTRDSYTYNLMLKQARSMDDGKEYLLEMLKEKIWPDDYTLTFFLESARDINTIIAHLDLPKKITQELNLPGILGGDESLIKELGKVISSDGQIRDVEKYVEKYVRETVSRQEYSWDILFNRKCRNDDEARIKRKILQYMENTPELQGFLQKSTIYSYCLEDSTMIPSTDDGLAFLKSIREKKGITKPDSYIYAKLLFIFKRENGKVEKLNSLFKEICDDLRDNESLIECLNIRLDFFNSYTEKQDCLLPGDDTTVSLTPLGFIEALEEGGLGVNEKTIRHFCYIASRGRADANSMAGIVGICRRRKSIELGYEMTCRLLKLYESSHPNVGKDDDNISYLNDVLNSFPSYVRNKMIAYHFSKGKSLDPIQTAREISRDNVPSATISYNKILHSYLSRFKDDKTAREKISKEKNFSDNILPYINEFYTDRIKPTAETIAILASSAGTMDQVTEVVKIAKSREIKQVSGHCFTSMLQAARSYVDIKKICDLYRGDINGIISPQLLSPLINTIQIQALKDDKCREMMSAISGYLFPGTDDDSTLEKSKDAIKKYKEEISILKYLDRDNPESIDIYIVRSVLRFLHFSTAQSDKDIRIGKIKNFFRTVFTRYRHVCGECAGEKAGFLESLAEDGFTGVGWESCYELFRQAAEVNPRTRVSFEFAVKLVDNIRCWTQYVNLMEAFKLTEPVWFAQLVPSLFKILYKRRYRRRDNSATDDDARIFNEIWCRVNCYAPLQRLYSGHFLPDGNAVSFSDPWMATRICESVDIYNKWKKEYSKDAVKKALYDTWNLDDAYYVALWFLVNEKAECKDINTRNERLREYEKRYVKLIRDHQLWPSFRTLLQLPLYWDAIQYTPGQDIVLAVISIHVELSEDEAYKNAVPGAITRKLRNYCKKMQNSLSPTGQVKVYLNSLNNVIKGKRFVMLPLGELSAILFPKSEA